MTYVYIPGRHEKGKNVSVDDIFNKTNSRDYFNQKELPYSIKTGLLKFNFNCMHVRTYV